MYLVAALWHVAAVQANLEGTYGPKDTKGTYDYIVAVAGSVGATLGAQLVQAEKSALLLEADPDDRWTGRTLTTLPLRHRRLSSSDKLMGLLLLGNPAASFQAFWTRSTIEALARADASMSEDKSEPSRAEQLRLQAEKAQLEAEKAELQAAVLELQAKRRELQSDQVQEAADVTGGERVVESAGLESLDAAGNTSSGEMTASAFTAATGKYHRFVTDEDPTFQNMTGAFCKTRETFFGTKKEGAYEGSFRVDFTMPGEDDRCKTIELMQTTTGKPSFAAVRIKARSFLRVAETVARRTIPLELRPTQLYSTHLVVENLQDPLKEEIMFGLTLEKATDFLLGFIKDPDENSLVREQLEKQVDLSFGADGTQTGDVIRAISLPQFKPREGEPPWQQMAREMSAKDVAQMDSEQGMLILDNKYPEELLDVLSLHVQMFGPEECLAVVIIERPGNAAPDRSVTGT